VRSGGLPREDERKEGLFMIGLHASRIYLASIDNLSVKIDDERRIGLLLIISYIYYSERGETRARLQAICE
jgi:hypothetical protein